MQYYGLSDIGKKRAENQDKIYIPDEDSDIKFSGNQRDWIEYIECPECGHEIDIVNRAFYKFKESKD